MTGAAFRYFFTCHGFLLGGLLYFIPAAAQNFEGEIVYKAEYKSLQPSLSDGQLTNILGSEQDYFIRNGDYKSLTNGVSIEWQLYRHAENRIYTRVAADSSVIWSDAAVNGDSVLDFKLNRDVTEVAGYRCDELIMTCRSGTQTYYFSSKFQADSALFANHKFGNWFDYLSKAHAIPLKMIIETPQFRMVSTAVRITSARLDPAMFELPPKVVVLKSPY